MTSPSSLPVYTQGFGTAFTGAPVVSPIAPSSADIQGPSGPFKIGQVWIDSVANDQYVLTSFSAFGGLVSANWIQTGSGSGILDGLTADTGGSAFPVAGLIRVVGNANQLSSLAGTGKIAFSLTNGISIGSFQGTTPPTGGLLVPGQSSFGSATFDSRAFISLNPSAIGPAVWTLQTTGTLARGGEIYFDNSIFAPPAGAANAVCYNSNTRFYVPSGQTLDFGACFFASPFVNVNVGTITTLYGFYAPSFFGPAGGTLTNAYGAYFTSPGSGTNQTSLYADDISSGVVASGVATKGTLRSAPPSSNTATTAFGAITFGTPKQNTLGYDIIVSGSVTISSATGAAVVLGVGSTATPTGDPITSSLTIAAVTTIGFSAYVPSGYYLSLAGLGGALTVDSVEAAATPV